METNKEKYERLKAAGICTHCGKNKIILGKERNLITICKKCKVKRDARSRLYRESKNPNKKILREKKEKMSLRLNQELNKM